VHQGAPRTPVRRHPASVREQLAPLLAATKADELMATTMIHDHAARRRSYELLAQAFELAGT
jgi:alkanesulfonate monooxygenase SsuD/methylene tetrahydromethanopterin reductase-like flavin-dependent oxidoreductase (luciferase family)